MKAGWEAVIGIETHVELSTESKMFCSCPVDFGDTPNTAVCPVCLALPGALPVPNEKAIEGIVKIGLALGCTINERSLFYRKNYFYPDLPKNYQISQYTYPVCEHGELVVLVEGEPTPIGITRVHMEEDTGKSAHVGDGGGRIHDADHTLLDFNRAGVPLVEIVTEPDIRTPDEARAYAAELQRIVLALGVSDARLEAGSMRFDVNVSVRRSGEAELGTRTETKNVNSLRSVQRAIAFEIDRQIDVLESGGVIVQETRHWNEDSGATAAMRSKEESEDYRYFQDPDLLPLEVSPQWRDEIAATIPELPPVKRARYMEAGVDEDTATTLVDNGALAELFDEALDAGAPARTVANWLTGDVIAHLRRTETDLGAMPLEAGHLVELASMVAERALSSTAAKEVLVGVLEGGGTPREVATDRDLIQVTDVSAIEGAVDEILAENQDAVAKIAGGDAKPLGFLVGQVMRKTGGKADPTVVRSLIEGKVSGS